VVGRRRLHHCRIWARWLRGVFVLEERLPRHLAAILKQNCADPLDAARPSPNARKFEKDGAAIVLKSSSTACTAGGLTLSFFSTAF
jgi:hypothetical protein